MIVGDPRVTGIATKRRFGAFGAIVVILVLLAAGAAGWWLYNSRNDQSGSHQAPTPVAVPTLQADQLTPENLTSDADQLLSVPSGDAEAINAAIPIASGGVPPARPLSLVRAEAEDISRARDCLTSAVYYEAGFEPEKGERAVAQVILNRVRHPLYPNTVCGVVYQGSDRPTGCQFTFTCDGSLARQPQKAAWLRAQKVATQALAGAVYAPVGWSTNYHADYVVPRWAGSLQKTAVIGHHIFYRLPDGLGAPRMFREAYAGNEPGAADTQVADAQPDSEPPDPQLPAARPVIDNIGPKLSSQSTGASNDSPTARWVIGAGGPARPSAQQQQQPPRRALEASSDDGVSSTNSGARPATAPTPGTKAD